jgi:hypothetical protein
VQKKAENQLSRKMRDETNIEFVDSQIEVKLTNGNITELAIPLLNFILKKT